MNFTNTAARRYGFVSRKREWPTFYINPGQTLDLSEEQAKIVEGSVAFNCGKIVRGVKEMPKGKRFTLDKVDADKAVRYVAQENDPTMIEFWSKSETRSEVLVALAKRAAELSASAGN